MKTTKLETWDELVCEYPNQQEPQPCFIELDLKAQAMRAAYNCEIGNAVPFSVWHGHDRRYPVALLCADSANQLMESLAVLAERVIAGYTSEWDGSNHNAEFSDEAFIADARIWELCSETFEWDDQDVISVWDASEWLGEDTLPTDEDRAGAQSNNIYLR